MVTLNFFDGNASRFSKLPVQTHAFAPSFDAIQYHSVPFKCGARPSLLLLYSSQDAHGVFASFLKLLFQPCQNRYSVNRASRIFAQRELCFLRLFILSHGVYSMYSIFNVECVNTILCGGTVCSLLFLDGFNFL